MARKPTDQRPLSQVVPVLTTSERSLLIFALNRRGGPGQHPAATYSNVGYFTHAFAVRRLKDAISAAVFIEEGAAAAAALLAKLEAPQPQEDPR